MYEPLRTDRSSAALALSLIGRREIRRRAPSAKSPRSPSFPLRLEVASAVNPSLSNHAGLRVLTLHSARKAWPCSGDGSAADPRFAQFAARCVVEIRAGEPHLESLESALPFGVGSKHCAACAVAFFPVRWRDELAEAEVLGAAPAAPAALLPEVLPGWVAAPVSAPAGVEVDPFSYAEGECPF